MNDINTNTNQISSSSSNHWFKISLWFFLLLILILFTLAAIFVPVIVLIVTTKTITISSSTTITTDVITARFIPNQLIDGNTVTCNIVNNSNPRYTECLDLRSNSFYFSNDVGCLSQWSTTIPTQWDPLGFCRRITGSSTANISIYYECDMNQWRIIWITNSWSYVQDIGFTRHLRCYY
ncbi:hypothetical protein I4U23_020394 [Adineta vaga]|nr:hypothetical protein I4U23_020394 [Adineta vaga]